VDLWNSALAAVSCSLLAVWELRRRYGDAFLVAASTIQIWAYLILHAGAAATFAYWLQIKFGAVPSGQSDSLTIIFTAVVGAFVFLHLSFSRTQIDVGETTLIGPAAITSQLIASADRALDRKAATARTEVIGSYIERLKNRVSEDPVINAKALEIRGDESLKTLLSEVIEKKLLDFPVDEQDLISQSIDEQARFRGLSTLKDLGLVDLRHQSSDSYIDGATALPTQIGLLVGDALGLQRSLANPFG
jgi:hypothetical protein